MEIYLEQKLYRSEMCDRCKKEFDTYKTKEQLTLEKKASNMDPRSPDILCNDCFMKCMSTTYS